MFKKRLYMDFAAATPLRREVEREMLRGMKAYANPSAPHEEGRKARSLIDSARSRIARTLAVKPENLIFTAGATEANNLAVGGVIEALVRKGAKPEDLHIITSGFEHLSLEAPVAYWKEQGVAVSYVTPNEEGIITPASVEKLIRPETVLVSIVAVQSEIGQIQPLKEISRMLEIYRQKREQTAVAFAPETPFPLLHTDASQSLLFVDLSPERLGVDLATYGAQKIQGPKGVGVLFKHSAVTLEPLMRGGKQERGVRPGTENVSGIVGAAKAFELAAKTRKSRTKQVERVRDFMVKLLEKEIPRAEINGGFKHRIANNINISIPGADGDYLAVLMDTEGVAVSARSVCVANGEGSRTIESLGKGKEYALGSLRFSFAPWVTKEDARRAVNALKKSLEVIDQAVEK